MEIEKKFLLKEKNKTSANEILFPNIKKLKKEIKQKQNKLIQSYLPLKLEKEIKKDLQIKINFKPNEIRLRKTSKDFFLTVKSKGSTSRKEIEKKITKEFYKKYLKQKISSLKKYRITKKIKGYNTDLDYYPKQKLLTAEVEVKTKRELKKIPKLGKDITKKDKYKNRKLAK